MIRWSDNKMIRWSDDQMITWSDNKMIRFKVIRWSCEGTLSCSPCGSDKQNESLSSPDTTSLLALTMIVMMMIMKTVKMMMKMWIRMVVSHLFKLVEGPSCLISLARLTRRLLSSLKFLPPWSPSCPPPPSPPPASWWSGSSTCPPAPVGSPGLILGEVVVGECGHTWFAASGLFKLQQYQAASDTWLEARLGRGAHTVFVCDCSEKWKSFDKHPPLSFSQKDKNTVIVYHF